MFWFLCTFMDSKKITTISVYFFGFWKRSHKFLCTFFGFLKRSHQFLYTFLNFEKDHTNLSINKGNIFLNLSVLLKTSDCELIVSLQFKYQGWLFFLGQKRRLQKYSQFTAQSWDFLERKGKFFLSCSNIILISVEIIQKYVTPTYKQSLVKEKAFENQQNGSIFIVHRS